MTTNELKQNQWAEITDDEWAVAMKDIASTADASARIVKLNKAFAELKNRAIKKGLSPALFD